MDVYQVMAVIGTITGLVSLFYTNHQWKKANKKVELLSDSREASKIHPNWWVERMMDDEWYFGLLTTDGSIIAFSNISNISDDGKWLDITLMMKDELPENSEEKSYITAVADDRRKASVQMDKVVMAYDIITS